MDKGRLKYSVPTGKPYTGAVTLPNGNYANRLRCDAITGWKTGES